MAALLALLGMVAGCQAPVQTVRPHPSGDGGELRTIAVVPFQAAIPEGEERRKTVFPLKPYRSDPAGEAASAEQAVEGVFLEKLRAQGRWDIIAPAEVAPAYLRQHPSRPGEDLGMFLARVGRDLQADAVAVGYVYRFRERKGTPYGVDQPASVAFEIHLFRVWDGAPAWRGAFDRTQRSLLEDVFQWPSFYREGGRWITARDLAAQGMEGMLKTFPGMP